ncbi:sperm-associated antigen 4 protein-like [Centropristis striata]|uniref:sperm-associated antigen 4 protein-like n=1 Tax=Centropristis striata TaxID=184440 RepID=UPI0027DFC5B7|nr:sperm-associated antigen 4 protein-like [Centropristis striata]
MSFSWLLLLAAGIVLFAVQHMQELQYKLQLLEQQMDTSSPVADTMSNFALESQGARVLDHLTSDMYWRQGYGILDYIAKSYWWGPSKEQRRVIQQWFEEVVTCRKQEGIPTISFKEGPHRSFGGGMVIAMDGIKWTFQITRSPLTDESNQTERTWTTGTVIIMRFLWLLFLAAVFVMQHMQITELKQEVQLLKQKMDTSFPVIDRVSSFALESQGARVLGHLSSDTYWPKGSGIWDEIFSWWWSSKAQRRVIQEHSSLRPGECWSVSGEKGHLVVSLSHPVSITQVTLGHITKSQSVSGLIASAPREFSIHGMSTHDGIGTYLGTLVYDHDGPAFQTFSLPNQDGGFFRYVKLQIENNCGNIDYTGVHSFRVHGKLLSRTWVDDLGQESKAWSRL